MAETLREALRAGAVAVKQFGWSRRKSRGGRSANGAPSTSRTPGQTKYRPETRSAGPKQLSAVGDLEPVRRARNGEPSRFVLTGYAPGTITSLRCGEDGYRLYQKGVKASARAGLTYEQIARIYYGKTLQLTDPGRHNIAGSLHGRGDTGAVVPVGDAIDVHVGSSNGSGFDMPSAAAGDRRERQRHARARIRRHRRRWRRRAGQPRKRRAEQPAHRGAPSRSAAVTGRRSRAGLGFRHRGRGLDQRARWPAGHPGSPWPATSTRTTTTTSRWWSPATTPGRARSTSCAPTSPPSGRSVRRMPAPSSRRRRAPSRVT